MGKAPGSGPGPARMICCVYLFWRPLWKRKRGCRRNAPGLRACTTTVCGREWRCRRIPRSFTVWGRTLRGRCSAVTWRTAGTRTTPIGFPVCRRVPFVRPGFPPWKPRCGPESHDYLYFVATGRDRGHVFSATLAQHNRGRAGLQAGPCGKGTGARLSSPLFEICGKKR